METKKKFEPVTHYYLTQEELKTMYLSLALSIYPYLRNPDYNEGALLWSLRKDFKQFQTDIQSLMEQMPNDNRLHKIYAFFVIHNKNLNIKKDA